MRSRRLCLEVAQEAVKCGGVRIVILPTGEVTDMAGAPDVSGPSLVGDHDGIIDANGEKHGLGALTSFSKAASTSVATQSLSIECSERISSTYHGPVLPRRCAGGTDHRS